MSWIQGFNQPYPGALQYLQAGGFMPTRAANPEREQNSCYPGLPWAIGLAPGVYGQPAAGALPNYGAPTPRLPNPNWSHARTPNFQGGVGAIGPAIGLSPMVYGIPFPGYPSLAQQQKVGVSPAEAQQWQEVYAAQLRDRGMMANPKVGPGWVRFGRPRMRNAGDCPQQVSPWYPTAGYGTGQYGSQYGPNPARELNAKRPPKRAQKAIVRNPCQCVSGYVHPTYGWICTQHKCPPSGEPELSESYEKVRHCVSCGKNTCCGVGMTVEKCCRLVSGGTLGRAPKRLVRRMRARMTARQNPILSISQIPEPWTTPSAGGGA